LGPSIYRRAQTRSHRSFGRHLVHQDNRSIRNASHRLERLKECNGHRCGVLIRRLNDPCHGSDALSSSCTLGGRTFRQQDRSASRWPRLSSVTECLQLRDWAGNFAASFGEAPLVREHMRGRAGHKALLQAFKYRQFFSKTAAAIARPAVCAPDPFAATHLTIFEKCLTSSKKEL
jgi:hypothetical protein